MLNFWLWLFSLRGISSRVLVDVRERCGGENAEVSGVIAAVARMVDGDVVNGYRGGRWRKRASKIADDLDRRQIGVVPYWDDRYPKQLLEISDHPAFLFYKGAWVDVRLDNSVAVVGTRKMSTYGESSVKKILSSVASEGITVVSGLAIGVDAAAHREVLSSDQTSDPKSGAPVAILPGGPEDGVPYGNRELYKNVVDSGMAVWEYLPGTALSRGMFASRNRIVAGLVPAVVVAESAAKGGACITADLALQYGREVGAVPGSIFSGVSEGTNGLLRQGAHVVRNGYDVVDLVHGVRGGVGERIDGGGGRDEGERDCNRRQKFYDRVGRELSLEPSIMDPLRQEFFDGAVTIDQLAILAKKDAAAMRVILTKLEMEGILRLEDGGLVKLIPP